MAELRLPNKKTIDISKCKLHPKNLENICNTAFYRAECKRHKNKQGYMA